MKALILHANLWQVRVESWSDRIGNCAPEKIHAEESSMAEEHTGEGTLPQPGILAREEMADCLAVLFHIEKRDSEKQVELLCKDIRKIARKLGTVRLMISGFAHLSSSRCEPQTAKALFFRVLETCRSWDGYEVRSSHFGYNKSLVLDIKGHADAYKHRSYDS